MYDIIDPDNYSKNIIDIYEYYRRQISTFLPEVN